MLDIFAVSPYLKAKNQNTNANPLVNEPNQMSPKNWDHESKDKLENTNTVINE